MTREELTARLRKLTGKTATDIEALDERVDALEAGGSSGGVEFNTLDVTVTYTGADHEFTGFITSTIPENTVITDIIKIERTAVVHSMATMTPLPTMKGQIDLNNNLNITGFEAFIVMDPPLDPVTMPLGIMFTQTDLENNSTEFTETFKITYV